MEPLIRLGSSGHETAGQKNYKDAMEKYGRQQEEKRRKKEEAVREKFNNLQAQVESEDGGFHNFCVAIQCSYLSPAQVKELLKDLRIEAPDDGGNEDELLKWLGALSVGEEELPEPL